MSPIETVPDVPPPVLERAIVWPWKETSAVWQELRYSMRSVEKFFEDKECPIFIFGTKKPGWLKNHPRVKFFESWSYTDALARGTQVAKKVLWMNDDIILLKPVSWEEVSKPLYLRPAKENPQPNVGNSWQIGVVNALDALKAAGIKQPLLYSTHTPYVYDADLVRAIIAKFGLSHKMPLELLLFNLHAENPEQIGNRKTMTAPFGDALYLNFNDHHLTPDLRSAIKELIPDYSSWELKAPFPS